MKVTMEGNALAAFAALSLLYSGSSSAATNELRSLALTCDPSSGISEAQCESLRAQYSRVVYGLLNGPAQARLRELPRVTIGKRRRRVTYMDTSELLRRLDPLLARIRAGRYVVQIRVDTEFEIAASDPVGHAITLGRYAREQCIGRAANEALCAGTLAHETIHLVLNDSESGSLVLDTPLRHYRGHIDSMPTYVVQRFVCESLGGDPILCR